VEALELPARLLAAERRREGHGDGERARRAPPRAWGAEALESCLCTGAAARSSRGKSEDVYHFIAYTAVGGKLYERTEEERSAPAVPLS
jgi:hypothetical protein